MLTVGPNLELLAGADYSDEYYSEFTRFLRGIDTLVQARVISNTIGIPPTDPEEGDAYIVPAGATGVWSTKVGKLARWTTQIACEDPTWEYYTPKKNWLVGVDDAGTDGLILRYNGTAWVAAVGEGGDEYVLSPATDVVLGGIKVGAGLEIDGNGVLSLEGGGSGYILPAATTDDLGGVKVGSGLAINGAGVLSATYSYTLPVATSSVLGGVKQGSNVTIGVDGTLSVAAPYTLPTASGAVIGGIRVGSGLTIGGTGILSTTYTYTLPIASAGALGGIRVGTGLAIDVDGILSTTGGGGGDYTLPVATTTILGGVKQGSNVTIDAEGILSVAPPYSLVTATADDLGGVKVGSGLAIDGSGHLSATYTYTLPVGTTTVLGGVKEGSNITIDVDGTLTVNSGAFEVAGAVADHVAAPDPHPQYLLSSEAYTLPTASASVIGGVRVGSGLAIDGSGILSGTYTYSLPVATTSVLGGVKDGAGLTIGGDGTASVDTRTDTTNIWTKGNSGAEVALPATTGTVTFDMALSDNWGGTLTGNITLANPTNAAVGQGGFIRTVQDATPRTIAYGTDWESEDGTMPTLTAVAGAKDLFAFYVAASGSIVIKKVAENHS